MDKSALSGEKKAYLLYHTYELDGKAFQPASWWKSIVEIAFECLD